MKELRYSAREFQPRNNRSMMQAFDTLLSVKIVRRTTHSHASILFFHRIEQNVVALDDLQRDDVILSGYERSKDVIRRLYYVYQYFFTDLLLAAFSHSNVCRKRNRICEN